MNSTAVKPLTEDQIHALVDDQQATDDLAELQVRLAQEPDAQATVRKWQQQRNALRGLHQDVLDEPLPSGLRAAAQQSAAAQQEINQWWRWGGMAAGIMLAFGVGWFSQIAWHSDWQSLSSTTASAKARAEQDFVRQAGFAHVVYSPEIRHPVEVTAAEQAHLVQWLSKRVGKPLKVPNLAAEGYDLVGGRLLPGEAGARAQFMFQNAAGVRITLYLGAVDKLPGSAEARETGFHFAPDGPIPSFYWIDQGFGYALSGPVSRAALMKLAEQVYHQL